MKIADLFVDIRVGGADKSVRALSSVSKGVAGVATASLAASAAIVGMVYALQRLSSPSNSEGAALKNFGVMTGLSTKKLQQYQFAGRQVNLVNEEISSSMFNLQTKMAELVKGKGAPEGMAWLYSTIDMSKTELEQTYDLFDQLQKFAVANKDRPELVRDELGSFGLSVGVQGGMFQGAFNKKVMSRAPFYTKSQIESLSKMKAEWTNLFDSIQRGIADINLNHISELLPEIRKLVTEILELVKALSTLAKETGIIGGVANALNHTGRLVTFTAGGVKALPGVPNAFMNDMKTAFGLSFPKTNGDKGGQIRDVTINMDILDAPPPPVIRDSVIQAMIDASAKNLPVGGD